MAGEAIEVAIKVEASRGLFWGGGCGDTAGEAVEVAIQEASGGNSWGVGCEDI